MKEYRIEISKVKKAEALLNEKAQEGWKVTAIMPNQAVGYGMIIVFEKDIK